MQQNTAPGTHRWDVARRCVGLYHVIDAAFFAVLFWKSAHGSDLLAAVSDDLAAIFGIHSLLFFKHSLNEIGTLLFQMLQIIVKCSHYPSAPFEQYSHFYERAQSLFRSYHLERRMTSRRCANLRAGCVH
ncbi:MAG: hypothetical protein UEX93_01470 [Peptococcaceae bacterium]|nr:hypothetical protein [Peptococcaceae bacterium]